MTDLVYKAHNMGPQASGSFTSPRACDHMLWFSSYYRGGHWGSQDYITQLIMTCPHLYPSTTWEAGKTCWTWLQVDICPCHHHHHHCHEHTWTDSVRARMLISFIPVGWTKTEQAWRQAEKWTLSHGGDATPPHTSSWIPPSITVAEASL